MNKLNPVSIKRLREIKAQILAEPRQFLMHSYFTESLNIQKPIPNCGTAACIAGWAISKAFTRNPDVAKSLAGGIEKEGIANNYLLLNEAQGKRLFHMSRWPDKFTKIGDEREGSPSFAKQAAARIDHFIRTHGSE